MSKTSMNTQNDVSAVSPQGSGSITVRNILYIIFRILLPLVVLIAGAMIALHLLETGPQAKTMPKKKNAALVKVMPVKFGTYQTVIDAMGVVRAAQSIAIKPQVSGKVISISEYLLPGGRFGKEDILLQLDPRDYQLSVSQQASAVAQAESNLELEEGNQIVARRELVLLGEQVSEAEEKLMLRQPQLNNLQVALEIAEAKYEQAQLNLDRTNIQAPFNGIVQTRDVNVGTWVSSSTSLATLIGSDSYWVEVSVPEGDLKWISFPEDPGEKGSKVKIYNPTAWSDESFREGRVIQLMPALETQGRMARLLVEVDDPLAIEPGNRGKAPLLIGSFVRVAIDGKPLQKALELSREHLRDGENIWVFSEDGRLVIRKVSVAFKSRDTVLITEGIAQGEKLIISSLAAPIAGMKVVLDGQSGSAKPGGGKKGKGMGKQSDQANSGQGAQE